MNNENLNLHTDLVHCVASPLYLVSEEDLEADATEKGNLLLIDVVSKSGKLLFTVEQNSN